MDQSSGDQFKHKRAMMSTNDMNGTHEEYPKDSLDRFGDDLCGLVLSYLSLKDSFRYECLSKQWRRSIHRKRHNLVMNSCLPKTDHYIDVERMDSQIFSSVVKKLPNITRIEITVKSEATERVFEVLMKSYKHLKTIKVWFCGRNDTQIANRLFETYGSRMTQILVPSTPVLKVFKRYTNYTKLTQLSSYGGALLELRDIFNDNNELLFKGLTAFQCNYTPNDNNLKLLSTFVSHYKNSLKTLDISIYNLLSDHYIQSLKVLSELKALRGLTFRTNLFKTNHYLIDYHCQEFVNQWPQLKRYQLIITIQSVPQLRLLLESFNRKKGLRHLSLLLRLEYWIISSEKCWDLSLNSLSGLKRLQHLDIDFDSVVVNPGFFYAIDTYLPRLMTLRFVSMTEMSAGIKESVERLPKLAKMSSNGQSISGEKYAKDSIDRYGDDLCGLVLSYLSFKENFQYECLSKQWRKSIHRKQHILVVNTFPSGHSKHHYLEVDRMVGPKEEDRMDLPAVKSVVKKLPNITSLEITVILETTERVFEVLMKSYKHLKTIHRTYGSRMTQIDIPRYLVPVLTRYINSYAKLTQLSYCGRIHLKLNDLFNGNHKLVVKGLTGFECSYYDSEDTLDCFVVDYHCNEFFYQWPQLQRYELEITYTTVPALRRVFESVNGMKGLRRLRLIFRLVFRTSRIHLDIDFDDLLISESFFEYIHIYLPRLKTLRFRAQLEMSAGVKESLERLPKLELFEFSNDKHKPYQIIVIPHTY
ncbi:unnamed protein product [Oppiella nova]|uniref:F-box domain-containing protein n=1 Tax=Oppiella nova TaxID=334625 RepID=A0A7R9LVU9_9ACAR|nr:unnamed protein product [Oppiella nova]CAG2167364.1 unnamed protein product [Oppiella nova]